MYCCELLDEIFHTCLIFSKLCLIYEERAYISRCASQLFNNSSNKIPPLGFSLELFNCDNVERLQIMFVVSV